MLRYLALVPMLLVCVARVVTGQAVGPSAGSGDSARSVSSALQEHLERGYITLPYPISLGNAPHVWFEGSIVPHFVVYQDRRFGLVVTPKVVVRMTRGGSVPVRTPSFMPRLQAFLFTGKAKADTAEFLTFTFAHYSNGQENDTLVRHDRSVNVVDGNFSTYYVEAGYFDLERDSLVVNALWAVVQLFLKPLTYEQLWGRYSPYRIKIGGNFLEKENLPISTELTILMGPSGGYLNRWYKRVAWSTSYYPTPPQLAWRDITPFINVYLGMDYYNVWFGTYRSMVRVGFATRFSRSSLLQLGPSPP